jgi:drug/metabolite transporter (DMT)-like permease
MPSLITVSYMPLRLLFAAVTINAVVSQLLLRRALIALGSPASLSELPRFVGNAALSPWIYASVALQILGYILWMLVVSREKLGVATASIGAGFYVLMALSAWLVYGESLSPLQWVGIVLVTLGVICISLAGVAH